MPNNWEKLRMAVAHSSTMASSSGSRCLGWGTQLPKYLAVMESTRLKRLPRSLAKSALILPIRDSSLKLASEPKCISRNRK